jgi:hypothetical protein
MQGTKTVGELYTHTPTAPLQKMIKNAQSPGSVTVSPQLFLGLESATAPTSDSR